MEDKIDLDATCLKVLAKLQEDKPLWTPKEYAKAMAREAIHQALVLAAKHAKATAHQNHDDYGTGEIWATVDEQSILNINNLVV